MDSLVVQLQRRYPLTLWRAHGFGCRGVGFGGAVFAVSPVIEGGRYAGQWTATATRGDGGESDVATGYPDAFAALEALRALGGEHMEALAPVDDYSRAQEPQERPFPGAGMWWLGKGCLMALLPSRWTVLVVAMALGCGALCMGWLTGGAQ